LPTDSEKQRIPKRGSERALIVTEMIERVSESFAHRLDQEKITEEEVFGVLQRSLERGLARLNEWGGMIANDDVSRENRKSAVEYFVSGILQISVAARFMLETLPLSDSELRDTTMNVVSGRHDNPQ